MRSTIPMGEILGAESTLGIKRPVGRVVELFLVGEGIWKFPTAAPWAFGKVSRLSGAILENYKGSFTTGRPFAWPSLRGVVGDF